MMKKLIERYLHRCANCKEVLSKPTYRYRSVTVTRKYCSQTCYHAHTKRCGRPLVRRNPDRICEQCNKPYRAATLRCKTRFCSNRCRGLWIRVSGIVSGVNSGRYGRSPKHPDRYPYVTVDGKDIKLRSSWEVVVAKYLDVQGIRWQYEPVKFDLGTSHYVPDFQLVDLDCFWEVKGWWSDYTQTKLQRFRELYPHIHLAVITKPVFDRIRQAVEEVD